MIALVASTVYFAITPLVEAQSELLARTRPTLFDVLIALFGGSAGIVSVTRRTNKGQVAPGVAIATALMPPLCTAGFGLSHLDFWIFLGAMNLFLINALFICLATLGFIRLMAFERMSEPEPGARRRIQLIISALTLAIVIPSIYTGFNVVQETRFKSAARRFISEQLTFADRSQLNVALRHRRDSSTIDMTLIGEPLPLAALDSISTRLPSYGLATTRLIVRQPLGAQPSIQEISDAVRQGVFRDLDARVQTSSSVPDPRIGALEAELRHSRTRTLPVAPMAKELGALFPEFRSLSVARVVTVTSSAMPAIDSAGLLNAVVGWSRLPSRAEQEKVRQFLALRLQRDSIRLTSTLER